MTSERGRRASCHYRCPAMAPRSQEYRADHGADLRVIDADLRVYLVARIDARDNSLATPRPHPSANQCPRGPMNLGLKVPLNCTNASERTPRPTGFERLITRRSRVQIPP